MSRIDAARSTWRAELHEYTAAALAGAGLTDMADEHKHAAEHERAYADLMTELADAKEGGDPAVIASVKQRVANFRKVARSGDVPRPGVVNDFAEPSNEELIGA